MLLFLVCILLWFIEERLHDVSIGVTDTDPRSVTPSPDNYRLCAHISGAVGAQLSVVCNQPCQVGRYLVVQLPGTVGILSLAEVEVYAGKHSCIASVCCVHISCAP